MVVAVRVGNVDVIRVDVLTDGLRRAEVKRRAVNGKQLAGWQQVGAARGHARGVDLHFVVQDQARRFARGAV